MPGRNARVPFIGMLVLFFGLMCGFSQTGLANAGRPAAGPPAFSILQNNQIAGSGSPDIIQVTLSPAPSPGDVLEFTVSGSSYNTEITTDPVTGIATLDLAGVTVGPATVDVYDETTGTDLGTVTVNFISGLPNINKSYLTVTASPVPADNTSQDVVEAVVKDQFGNLVADGTSVTFTINPVGAATITTTGVTSGGIVYAYFTSSIVGFVQVQATTTGVSGPFAIDAQGTQGTASPVNFVTIQFTTPPPSPATSYIVATVTPMPADGTSQDVVEAVLLQANGQPVADGTSVTFTINPVGAATITTTGVTSGGGGVVYAYFTSLIVGFVQVQAQTTGSSGLFYVDAQGTQGTASPVNFVTIQFTTPPPDPALSSIVAVVTPVSADGLMQDVVTATIYNTAGQLEGAGIPLTFTYPFGSATSGMTMTTTGVTNAQGVATAYFTSTVVGTAGVQAQVMVSGVLSSPIPWANNSALNVADIAFVQTGVDPALSYITVFQNPATADNLAQDIVEVFLFDSSGNAITTPTQVTFNVPSTTTAASTTTPSAANTAQVAYVSSTVGFDQVTATVTVGGVAYYLPSQSNVGNPYVNSPSSNYVTIQFVTSTPVTGPPGGGGGGSSGGGGSTPPGGGGTGSNPSNPSGPGQGYTYVVMTWNDMEADGVQADTATAYITDAYLHPIPNTWVIFTFTPGGSANSGAELQPGNATIIDSVQTNQNGFAAIGITDTVVGTAWVDAWIRGTNGLLEEIDGDSVLANFTPAPDVNNPQTQLITIVYEALADGVSRTAVEAHVVDYAGQPIVGASVQFTIDSGTAQIVGSQPVITDANGNAVIYLTSTTAGNVLVTATVGGKAIIYGSPARVYFAPINIYVPRVFTPNGDGTNDVLKPILVGIQTFQYFTVYNRWGNIIFQTTDPNQGWDGTFKGVPQPVETYLWIAAGIDDNGKTIVQKGMTSLAR